MMMRGWYFGGGSGIWWLLGLVCMIVIVAGIVWLVVSLARRDHAGTPQQPWQAPYAGQPPFAGQPPYPGPGVMPPTPPRPTPHDIVRERLARGDITVEDFGRTMAALGPDPYAPPAQTTPPTQPPAPRA